MNRTKYRACLIFLLLAALLCGMMYYTNRQRQESEGREGTLVYHLERLSEEEGNIAA